MQQHLMRHADELFAGSEHTRTDAQAHVVSCVSLDRGHLEHLVSMLNPPSEHQKGSAACTVLFTSEVGQTSKSVASHSEKQEGCRKSWR